MKKKISAKLIILLLILIIQIRIFSKDINKNYEKGFYYLENKKYDKAIEYLKKAEEETKDDYNLYYGLGNAYKKLGKVKEAIIYYEKAYKSAKSKEEIFEAAGVIASLYYNQENPDLSIEFCKKALNNTQSTSDLIRIYSLFGLVYTQKEMYQEAIKYFNKVISFDNSNDFSHYGLGKVYLNQKEYQKAISEFKKAIDINPTYIKSHKFISIAYYELDDYERAIQHTEKALKLINDLPSTERNKEKAMILNNYAWILLKAKDEKIKNPKKALKYAEEVVYKLDDSYSEHWGTLAEAYYQNKMKDRAIEAIKKAIELEPSNEEYKNSLKEYKEK